VIDSCQPLIVVMYLTWVAAEIRFTN